MSQKLQKRLEQLIQQAEHIIALTVLQPSEMLGTIEVFKDNGNDLYVQWIVQSKNILKLASGGEDTVHYETFIKLEKPHAFESKSSVLKRLVNVLRASLDDLNNGFLVSFKQIVQAEVFDSELEQAKSFLASGYKNPSAVIAGVVLETAIKELCITHGIELERKKLTHLNDELAKLGVYNKLQQKQITPLADIRNNAAHGDYDQFTVDDVARMINDIERFLLTYSS